MILASVLALALLPETVLVTPGYLFQAVEPQVAIDADSRIYISYGMGTGTYVSTSNNKGASYGDPVRVADTPKLALGMRRGPRITVHKGVVTVTVISHGSGNLMAFRSADKGKTWSGPVAVNSVDGSAREGLHGMAVAPDGTIACAWLDLREKGTTLYTAFSKNGGASWSPNRLVYASPSGTICECCHPSLTFDAKGKLYVMFRNSLEGSRDMYLTSSTNLQTFSPAVKLGQGTWKLNACPMDGGMLALDPSGAVQTVWRRNRQVFMSSATGSERALDTAQQPWLTSMAQGLTAIWQRGKEIILAAGAEPVPVSSNGSSPVVASSPDGKLVIAAWAEDGIRSVAVSR